MGVGHRHPRAAEIRWAQKRCAAVERSVHSCALSWNVALLGTVAWRKGSDIIKAFHCL